jgi:hypothetical protein
LSGTAVIPSLRAALIITTWPGEFCPHQITFDSPGLIPSVSSRLPNRLDSSSSSAKVIVVTVPSGRSSMIAGFSPWLAA